MSLNRHTIDVDLPRGTSAMVVGAARLPAGVEIPEHRHAQHQIVWAPTGVLTVVAVSRSWVLPPTRALFVPAGTPHVTGSRDGADLRGVYLEPDLATTSFVTPTLLRVSRLLHELFDHLISTELGDAQRERAQALVFDLLEPIDVIPVGAPMPVDDRAVALAMMWLTNPTDQRSLAELAAEAGFSSRTAARLFDAETGMTAGQWRTQARLAAALPLLASGVAVSRVAPRVGYATSSAFVDAFRRYTGVSPARYFR
ncbi:helix-turn-helix domain-containing protein [Gordonia sp. CPCC 205333]|uniref:AraC family transcriptional regulator n=1 Tax=Gordonia sp. CPCC 205333 TaxID=3140790 RepID=UPI003AF3516E